MKKLTTILTSLALAATPLALNSCDGEAADNSSSFDFNIARYDFAALTATDTAELPVVLAEGDTFTFVAATTTREDEEIPGLPYETTMVTDNIRHVEILRRPDGFDPSSIIPRTGFWLRNGGDATVATISTRDSIDSDTLNRIARTSITSSGTSELKVALEDRDPDQITEPHAEEIELAFQKLGIECYNNADDDNIKVTIRREIEFTATSTNADLTGALTITGTYTITEINKNMVVDRETNPGYMTPSLEIEEFRNVAGTGTFTLVLSGVNL